MNPEQIILNAIAQSQVQVSGMTSGGQAGDVVSIRTEAQTINARCYSSIPSGACTAFLVNGQWLAVGAGTGRLIRQRNVELRRRRSSEAVTPAGSDVVILYRKRNEDNMEHWVNYKGNEFLAKATPLFGSQATQNLSTTSVEIGNAAIPDLWGGAQFLQIDSTGAFSTTDPEPDGATAGVAYGILYPSGIVDGDWVAWANDQGIPTASNSYSVSTSGEITKYTHKLRLQIPYELGAELPLNDINKSRSVSMTITYRPLYPSKSWFHVIGGSLHMGVAWQVDANGFVNIEYYSISESGATLATVSSGSAFKADRDLDSEPFDPASPNTGAIEDILERDINLGTSSYGIGQNGLNRYWYLADTTDFWITDAAQSTIAAGGTIQMHRVEGRNAVETKDVTVPAIALNPNSGDSSGFDNGFLTDTAELKITDDFKEGYDDFDIIEGILLV